MKLDQKVLRQHILTLLAEHPEVGALMEIRSKDALPIRHKFRIDVEEETASFPIYSIAKTILAILTLQLVNLGQLNLDTEIGKYVKREIPHWLKKHRLESSSPIAPALSTMGNLIAITRPSELDPGMLMGVKAMWRRSSIRVLSLKQEHHFFTQTLVTC